MIKVKFWLSTNCFYRLYVNLKKNGLLLVPTISDKWLWFVWVLPLIEKTLKKQVPEWSLALRGQHFTCGTTTENNWAFGGVLFWWYQVSSFQVHDLLNSQCYIGQTKWESLYTDTAWRDSAGASVTLSQLQTSLTSESVSHEREIAHNFTSNMNFISKEKYIRILPLHFILTPSPRTVYSVQVWSINCVYENSKIPATWITTIAKYDFKTSAILWCESFIPNNVWM